MYHYSQSVQNRAGDILPGYFVQVYSALGVVVPIYSDRSSTPIITASGIANMALVDTNGTASLYVADGSYTVKIFAPDGVTLKNTYLDVPMVAALSLTVGTVTTLGPGALAMASIDNSVIPALLNLSIPVGPSGTAGTAGTAGTSTNPSYVYAINTLAPGAASTLAATGTYPNITLTFGIPKGDAGTSGALGDGVYGDIAVSGTGSILTVGAAKITLAKMANLAATSIMGNNTGIAGVPLALTYAQVKTALAVDNLDNTSDANKPVSTATTAALALKAPLASPPLTGVPTAPTAATSDNSTTVATTAFVRAQLYLSTASAAGTYAPLNNAPLTGTATVNGVEIGFRNIPITTKAAAFTFADADRATGIYYTGAAAAATINPNATTAIGVGAAIPGFNNGTGALTLTRGAGVALQIGGTVTGKDVVVAVGGRFTLIQWAINVWTVDGAGVS